MYLKTKNALINTDAIAYISNLTRSSKNGSEWVSFVHFVGGDYAMLTEDEYDSLMEYYENEEDYAYIDELGEEE